MAAMNQIKRQILSRTLLCITLLVNLCSIVSAQLSDNSWKKLFNGKNLDEWTSCLGTSGRNSPFLVNQDSKKVFQVYDGQLHLYKDHNVDSLVQEGFIYTNLEYKNYSLRFEYKWGGKKYLQRKGRNKSSGLLFHIQEPNLIWPTSIQCQISEGTTGEIFTQNYAMFTTTVDSLIFEQQTKTKIPRHSRNGQILEYGGKQESMRMLINGSFDKVDGWNTVEIIVKEDSAKFYVNGKLAANIWNIKDHSPKSSNRKALKMGRIGIQAEASEINFRNIEIKMENE